MGNWLRELLQVLLFPLKVDRRVPGTDGPHLQPVRKVCKCNVCKLERCHAQRSVKERNEEAQKLLFHCLEFSESVLDINFQLQNGGKVIFP